jgi:hypothetical protein
VAEARIPAAHAILHSKAGLISVASGCREVTGTAEELKAFGRAIAAAVRRAERAEAEGEALPIRASIDDSDT